MLSMQVTNAASTDQANLQWMCRYGHLVSLPFPICHALQSDGSQIVPVTLGTCFGTTHARQDVLFHDDPPAIIVHAQPICDGRKRHIALAQFTENSVTQRSKIVPASVASCFCNPRLAILEMDMLDTFAETLQAILDVGAIIAASAVEEVTSIEHQPQQV